MMTYPMYNNQMYINDLQQMRDRIDSQMRQIQNPPQMQQPTAINQTFQLAPNQTTTDLESKFVTNIDEVKNTLVLKTGLFITKDYSQLWVKDVTGNIRIFTTSEVIELDEKDKQIIALQKQIEDLKGAILNAKCDDIDVNESITDKKSTGVSNTK